jgi:hypothetical protein
MFLVIMIYSPLSGPISILELATEEGADHAQEGDDARARSHGILVTPEVPHHRPGAGGQDAGRIGILARFAAIVLVIGEDRVAIVVLELGPERGATRLCLVDRDQFEPAVSTIGYCFCQCVHAAALSRSWAIGAAERSASLRERRRLQSGAIRQHTPGRWAAR